MALSTVSSLDEAFTAAPLLVIAEGEGEGEGANEKSEEPHAAEVMDESKDAAKKEVEEEALRNATKNDMQVDGEGKAVETAEATSGEAEKGVESDVKEVREEGGDGEKNESK